MNDIAACTLGQIGMMVPRVSVASAPAGEPRPGARVGRVGEVKTASRIPSIPANFRSTARSPVGALAGRQYTALSFD